MIDKEMIEGYKKKKERIMAILAEDNGTFLDGNSILKYCQIELDMILIKSNNVFMEKSRTQNGKKTKNRKN